MVQARRATHESKIADYLTARANNTKRPNMSSPTKGWHNTGGWFSFPEDFDYLYNEGNPLVVELPGRMREGYVWPNYHVRPVPRAELATELKDRTNAVPDLQKITDPKMHALAAMLGPAVALPLFFRPDPPVVIDPLRNAGPRGYTPGPTRALP